MGDAWRETRKNKGRHSLWRGCVLQKLWFVLYCSFSLWSVAGRCCQMSRSVSSRAHVWCEYYWWAGWITPLSFFHDSEERPLLRLCCLPNGESNESGNAGGPQALTWWSGTVFASRSSPLDRRLYGGCLPQVWAPTAFGRGQTGRRNKYSPS